MIIVCKGIKGDRDSITIAVTLAILTSDEREVLLVDADNQASVTDFTLVRNETFYHLPILHKLLFTNELRLL